MSAALGRVWLLVATLLLLAAPAAADPTFPKLTGRVVDAAGVLPPAVRADLEAKSAGLEQRTGAQLVVATIPDLQGYEIEEYGYRLGRAWGIGRAGKNDGVILLVAPNDRRVRVEVGYGLEPVLTDALSSRIVRETILPRFRAGDLPGGVSAGADAIVTQLGLPPEQAAAAAQAAETQARTAPQGAPQGMGLGGIIFTILLLLWFVYAFRRSFGRSSGVYGRRRYGAPVVLWGPGLGGGWGGGSSWGGGGGGGFGGFSGGGGSFGGGGSSGSW